MNFFASKLRNKSPAELVRLLRDNTIKLEAGYAANNNMEASEEISKSLSAMKSILNGEAGDQDSLGGITQLANEVYSQDVLKLLILNMPKFDFEAKKDASQIFNLLLRRQIGHRSPTVDYVGRNKELIYLVLRGYENEDVALNTGTILKELLRYENLARILLYSDEFYLFLDYIEKTSFGTSCDAFANMKECLTRHKPMVAQYLDQHYDRFFTAYKGLILSPNYVTKRQSLKLLGEILLDRANYGIMTRYIASTENLQIIMNTLRDKSRNIQFEAFHVFKVFVANPNKPPAIANILRKNKDKLLAYLREFHKDREDELFNDEKAYLINQIEAL
ncbi:putative transcriptional repressor [Filobasidium floriforme]|uniref:putative transcriptional repressor n=1 Tax=Filobasidium floriforme TaxID=5210 RepID=UPI001E8CAC62|nr:putative transcriptional repressor [Filobasidium floriforme]KAH8088421.1 putative transcriptional repressor [Filobasidium floriforme]